MKCGGGNPELGEVGRERNEHSRGQGGVEAGNSLVPTAFIEV